MYNEQFNFDEIRIPRIVPEPLWCKNVSQPVHCLDGKWDIIDDKDSKLYKAEVPMDTCVYRFQGLSQKYEYKHEVFLPELESSNRVVLRFEGVNGFANVFVDDIWVAAHENGFLTWNVEITEQVKDKQSFQLRIVMDEETDQVSAYNHGGIIHSVYMYILPGAYVSAMYLSPLFDEDMETCILRADVDLEEASGEYAGHFIIRDPDGKIVMDSVKTLKWKSNGYYTVQFAIDSPKLWDAEHPRMYDVEMELLDGEEKLETVTKRIGLRQVERKGNRLFVNKQEIKLRGACRHETSPLNGRATSRELIEKDVALFKEANCNYIRTSHYPPSDYFLELCDKYGIYVEDELALAFIARTLPYTQRDPKETNRYLSHFTECLARDYNHSCVIIWSLCNESFGGYNFDLLNKFIHKKDPTRMTKFSYPMTIQEEHEMPDIWSIHYSEYDADLAGKRDNLSVGYAPGKDLPVLHDEYVHVCCYNREELRRDPSARSFWGESIRIFWDNIWNTEGALGGAIWAGIDETDVYIGGKTQLEWGIIDTWRRKKPEFYLTRKAYTPIKILHHQFDWEIGKLILIIHNRFCHTNLSEVKLTWQWDGHKGSCMLPEGKPFQTIKAVLYLEKTESNVMNDEGDELLEGAEGLSMIFGDAADFIVEEFLIEKEGSAVQKKIKMPEEKQKENIIDVVEKMDHYIFTGKHFCIRWNKHTGLLDELRVNGEKILAGGPFLNVPYLKLGAWYMRECKVEKNGQDIFLKIQGGYEDTLCMTWEIVLNADGQLFTKYTIDQIEKTLPKQIKLRVGVDCGGLDELGAYYIADSSMDTLTWKRKVDVDSQGSFTWYPSDHISRNEGTAHKTAPLNQWGEVPVMVWKDDVKNDLLFGAYDVTYKGTNDFRSTKENVISARLYNKENGQGICVKPDGIYQVNVRLEVMDPEEWKIPENSPEILYAGTWYTVEDKKESDHGTEKWSHEKGAYAECNFTGTGIVWYGPQDTTYGMANVYVDGKLMAEKLSQRVAGVDFSCSSVGYDKKYHLPIYSISDLPYGTHTLRIEVCGEKANDATDSYIVIDYFRVLTGECVEPVKLIVNQKYAFPHISWGNYRRPEIMIDEKTKGRFILQF